MQRTFLTCYSFQIHPSGKPKEFLNFDNLPRTNKLFREALWSYLAHHQSSAIIQDASYHQISDLKKDGELIFGNFVSGEYGVSSKFRNVDTEEDTFHRTPSDAEQIPYYFLFYFKDEENRGILITQRNGIKGIVTPLKNVIHSYLSRQYGTIIVFNDLIPTEVYEYLKGGKTTKITLNHIKLPNDTSDMLGWEGVDVEEIAEVQLVIKSKRGMILPISDRIKNQYTSIVEQRFDSSEENLQDVDIEVTYGGNKRTVRLDNTKSFSPVIDISPEVSVTDGIPCYTDIHKQALSLLDDVRPKIKGF